MFCSRFRVKLTKLNHVSCLNWCRTNSNIDPPYCSLDPAGLNSYTFDLFQRLFTKNKNKNSNDIFQWQRCRHSKLEIGRWRECPKNYVVTSGTSGPSSTATTIKDSNTVSSTFTQAQKHRSQPQNWLWILTQDLRKRFTSWWCSVTE